MGVPGELCPQRSGRVKTWVEGRAPTFIDVHGLRATCRCRRGHLSFAVQPRILSAMLRGLPAEALGGARRARGACVREGADPVSGMRHKAAPARRAHPDRAGARGAQPPCPDCRGHARASAPRELECPSGAWPSSLWRCNHGRSLRGRRSGAGAQPGGRLPGAPYCDSSVAGVGRRRRGRGQPQRGRVVAARQRRACGAPVQDLAVPGRARARDAEGGGHRSYVGSANCPKVHGGKRCEQPCADLWRGGADRRLKHRGDR
mmetsp:Transcript_14926/g.42906  ORF Transcript_14926/g.42906 Transcript_14926/m.42906 type:complete len:260 (-) Transcript_14926:181-960(-)